jgi:hypothetical protein
MFLPLLFFFDKAISLNIRKLRHCVAGWSTHLLSFVPFTPEEHLIEV